MRRRKHAIKPILMMFIFGIVFLLVPWGSAVGGPGEPSGTGDAVKVGIQLERSYFTAKLRTEEIRVMFNPSEVAVKKTVPWNKHDIEGLDPPKLQFTHGRSFSLRVNLTVDEEDVEGGDVTLPAIVMEQYIIENRDVKKPEPILIKWGESEFKFRGVLEKIDVKYTMFLPDGTPVRAEISSTWKEFTPAEEQLKQAPRH